MKSCTWCGKKLNMWRSLVGESGHCNDCDKKWYEFIKKYQSWKKLSDSDPRTCALVAICNLLWAERLNVTASGREPITRALVGKPQKSWEDNKTKAIKFAQGGLSLVPEGSAGRNLLTHILNIAEGLQSPKAKEINVVVDAGLFHVALIPSGEDFGISSGKVMVEDVQNALASMPELDWVADMFP